MTAFSPNFAVLAVFRFIAGAGIGGEYSAIYSAVDELIPARYRGQVALAISGSYWIGAMMGSALGIVLLNENIVNQYYGWRIAFLLGAVLGLAILVIRRHIPESPRWLAIHNRNDEAEAIAGQIEDQIRRSTGRASAPSCVPCSRSTRSALFWASRSWARRPSCTTPSSSHTA